jgi:hypothetical protein
VSAGAGPSRPVVGARSGRWSGGGALNWWRAGAPSPTRPRGEAVSSGRVVGAIGVGGGAEWRPLGAGRGKKKRGNAAVACLSS